MTEKQPQPTRWDSEPVYSANVVIPIFNETLDLSVSAEVPMHGNERLPRLGHRWYPTLINIDGPCDYTLHPETARELARRLIEAADAADAVDLPDTAPCGHWAPCDCRCCASDRAARETQPKEIASYTLREHGREGR